ncbi:MAG: BrnT family toxin [bacterium]
MDHITFQWDTHKNSINKKKHNVSFEEAKTVFYDEKARLIHDPEHSDSEDRFILLGLSSSLRLLVVVHSYKKQDEIIRIISARKATKSESLYYFKWWKK